jgi:hypothetical protein
MIIVRTTASTTPTVPVTFDRTIFSLAATPLNNDDTGISGYTSLTKLLPAVLLASANYLRVTLNGPSSGSCVINDFTVCQVAASGDAYDGLAAPTPFSGSASVTLTAGQVLVTDALAFAFDNTKAHIFGFNLGSTTRVRYRSSLSSNHIHYKKAAVQEADNADRGASYTTQSGRSYMMTLIEGAA